MATGFPRFGRYADVADRVIAMPNTQAASNLSDLDKHDRLEEALKTITNLAREGNTSSDEFVACMKTASAAADELKQECITRLPSGAINQRCPKHALGLAQRIFNIPELLEMILSTLSIRELLNVERVNRQFRDCVDSSVILQRALSLRPDPESGHLTAPFEDHQALPGLNTAITFLDDRLFGMPPAPIPQLSGNEVILRAAIDGPHRRAYAKLPQHIGSRVRKMFVAQPPPVQMIVKASCCAPPPFHFGPPPPNQPPPPPEDSVSNSNGLTLGDIFDKAKTLIEKHRNCPHAPDFMLDRITGEVQLTIYFSATVEVDAADPVLKRKKKHCKALREAQEGYRTSDALLQAFSAAKRTAAANGTPIPTLEEFKASQGDSSSV